MKKSWMMAVVFLVGIGGLTLLINSGNSSDNQTPPTLDTGYVFPAPKPLPPFKLTDQHGQTFDNQRLIGKWSLIFLGYTSCPDICPTTMSKLAAAYPELNQENSLQVIFLSVDPARDTPTRLAQYAAFFNPEFLAITGEHSELYSLTRSLGMVYTMVGDGPDYQVDHSASIVVISPKGERYAVFKPKSDGQSIPQIRNQALISDMRLIRHQY